MSKSLEAATDDSSIKHRDYDLVVSFAGEDRELVASIVEKCKAKHYSVFYDEDEVAAMWGEDLVEYFADTYETRSRAALMFVSEHYARKAWTTHERRSILVRALNQATSEDGPYMFPVRIDDTRLSGVRESIAYVDARKSTADEIVGFIEAKLGAPMNKPIEPVTRAPHTDEECGIVLSERPVLWEYYYTAYLLIGAIRERRGRIRDAQSGFYSPGDLVDTSKALDLGAEEMARLSGIVQAFEGLLNGPIQAEAWGRPGDQGDPGDVEAIEHLADRYAKVLDMLLEWSERIGGYASVSSEVSEYFQALRRYVDQPIAAIADFAEVFRTQVDTFHERIHNGEDIHLELPITWEVPADVSAAFSIAQQRLADSPESS